MRSSDFILLLVLMMLLELREVIPSVAVVEEVSIAGSMSDSMEERGDGGIMVAACATLVVEG